MSKPFRVEEITFRAGPSPGEPPSSIRPGSVTLLVGPNNSGKSKTLEDIDQWGSGGQVPPVPWQGGVVVASVTARWPNDLDELRRFLEPRTLPDQPEPEQSVRINAFRPEGQGGMPTETGEQVISLAGFTGDLAMFCRSAVMPFYKVRLDGRSRFALAEPRQVTAPDRGPSSHVMALWRDPAALIEVSAMTQAAFGLHFVINAADLPSLSISLSEDPPPHDWENSLADAVLAHQRSAMPLNETSDGVQVYTGLVAAVQAMPQTVILIDEPEAHLHPTLASRLGANLARLATERSANLIAATHSAEFLMGCVGEVPETTIVRLTYQRDVATARALPGGEVARLTRDPLLRSADALSALFSATCVVCEADADRAFYEEINRRLERSGSRRSNPDAAFLNAQNWQTIPAIAGPLRRLGIPGAAVVDLDTLIEGSGWPPFFAMLGADDALRGGLAQRRDAAGRALAAAGRVGDNDSPWRCKRDGIGCLEGTDLAVVQDFIDELATYGIFVVDVGELENWLPDLCVTNKKSWVTDMLQRLGSVGAASYVPPGQGDAWAFVERMAAWSADPQRRGIPRTAE